MVGSTNVQIGIRRPVIEVVEEGKKWYFPIDTVARYADIGSVSRQVHVVRAPCRLRLARTPLAATFEPDGTLTRKV